MSEIGIVSGTTPYPWPWDGGCPGHRLALVVAGWDPGWRSRADAVAVAAAEPRVAALAEAVAAVDGLVVPVGHAVPALPSPGKPVVAAGIDAFHGSGVDAALRAAGATHLLVAGHGLEAPVHSTLRSANDRGYECLLVLDACSTLRPDLEAAARSMVEMSGGIFGAVGATADVLDALLPIPVPVQGA